MKNASRTNSSKRGSEHADIVSLSMDAATIETLQTAIGASSEGASAILLTCDDHEST